MTTERTEWILGELRAKQSTMDNDSKEGNFDGNGFWSYSPSPDDPHEFGECMKD